MTWFMMGRGNNGCRSIGHLLLFLLLPLFLDFLFIVPGAQSRRHHHQRPHQHQPRLHRSSHRRHKAELIEPSLSCHANLTATVRTGSYAKVLVEEADARDPKCRSQRVGDSINFNLKTDCRVQKSVGDVFNFTIIARRFPGIAVDADRKIPMKCTFHLTGAATGKWNVADDPNIDTVSSGLIIHEKDEDIVLVDPDNVDASALDAQPKAKVIPQSRKGNNNVQIHRDANSLEAMQSNMLASERRNIEVRLKEDRLQREDVLPDGRIVFRPEKFWYLAPLLAAVVFVAVFILVVYVRQKERSRKLLRLSTKKRLATARTPTLEDIRAIVGQEGKVDARDEGTSDGSATNKEDIRAIVGQEEKVDARDEATSVGSERNEEADVGQVTPEFDLK